MKITYDPEADALYIKLKNGTFAKNKVVDDLTILDLNRKGDLLGIEILDASKRIKSKSVAQLNALISA